MAESRNTVDVRDRVGAVPELIQGNAAAFQPETRLYYVADNLRSFQTWWLLLEKARSGDPNRVTRVIHMHLTKGCELYYTDVLGVHLVLTNLRPYLFFVGFAAFMSF